MQKMGGAFANYFHFCTCYVIPEVRDHRPSDATWLAATILSREYYAARSIYFTLFYTCVGRL